MPKSRRRRWIIKSLGIVLALAILIVALLPTIFSSDWGRDYIRDKINASIPGTVRIGGMELGWWSAPSLSGVELLDDEGQSVLRFDKLVTQASLAGLAGGDYGLGTIEIKGLKLDLARDAKGTLNLTRAIGPGKPTEKKPLADVLRELQVPPSLAVALKVRDAEITVRDPAFPEPIVCAPLRGDLVYGSDGASLLLEATVGPGGTFTVQAKMQGIDADGRLELEDARAELTAKAQWDRAAEFGRRLADWSGNELTLKSTVTASKDGFDCELEITSERLQVAGAGQAALLATGPARRFRLTRPIEVNGTLDPRLLAGDDSLELPAELGLTLKIERLAGPLAAEWADIGINATFGIGDANARIRVGGEQHDIAWRNWQADVASESLGESVAVGLAGNLSTEGQDGSFSLRAEGRGLAGVATAREAAARIDGELHLVDFPLAPIDRFVERALGRKGVLVDAIGDRLGLDVRSAESGYEVKARSARLEIEGALAVVEETLQGEGLRLEWTITPDLVRGLAPDVRLDKEVPLRLAADSVVFALGSFDPHAASLRGGKLTVGDGSVALSKDNELKWRGLGAEVDAPRLSESITIRGGGELAEGGRLDLRGEVRSLWSGTGEFQPGQFQGEFAAALTGMPMGPASRALGQGDLLVSALGDRCDFKLAARGGATDTEVRLDLSSPLIEATVPARIGDDLQVGPDATLRYRLRPALVNDLDAGFALDEEAVLDVTVQSLRLALPRGDTPFRVREGKAALRSTDLVVSGAQSARLRGLVGSFLMPPDAPAGATVQCRVEPAAGKLQDAIGGPLTIELKADLPWDQPALVKANLKSALLQLEAAARVDKERLVLAEPATLNCEVQPALLDGKLASPAKMRVRVARLELPLTDFDITRIAAAATVGVPALALRGEREIRIDDIELTANLGNDLVVEGSGSVAGAAAPFALRANVAGWSAWRQATVAATIERFPTAILAALPGVEQKQATLFGDEAVLQLNADLPAETASLRVRMTRFELDADCKVAEEVTLVRPATGRCTVSAEAWETFAGARLALQRPVEVKVQLQSLRVPLPVVLDTIALKGTAAVADLGLRDAASSTDFALQNFRLSVDTAGLGESLRADLTGKTRAGEHGGTIDGKVDVANLAGGITGITTKGELVVKDVPVAPLDRVLQLDGYGKASLGPTVSVGAKWELDTGRGPVWLKIDAKHARAGVDARVTREGVRLAKPVEAELELTKELGDLVLPKLGPLFQGVESTEKPILVRIEPDGFLVPLERMDVRRIRVPKARVELGKVVLKNKLLTEVILAVTRARAEDESTRAWFTPLELEMQNGVVRYRKRLDLLMQETMHMANWGTVDLGQNRTDLTIAFMPEALRKHLFVTRAKEGDALRIPVRGTVDNPKVKFGTTLKDLAAIQARDKAIDQLRTSIGRKIAEKTLGRLIGKILRQGPIPEPSVDPLPWKKQN